ncbi:DUF1127 domain-containing protein [Roseovarius sp. S4756]|uniref:DUF1127 domain-containing protein n=1 Tax=Roseovarius maritimus TaxID=3342637 RepID=UPI00372AB70B
MTTLIHSRPATALRPLRLGSLIALSRSRRALAALNDAALSDIGLTPAEARREARRAFWDIPQTWRARGRC